MRILFVCGRARARSPTAERIFARVPGIETASAGVSPDADEPVDVDHLAWAEIVVVMEPAHRRKLMRRFGAHLRGVRLVCLDVPDAYAFMAPALVRLLEAGRGGTRDAAEGSPSDVRCRQPHCRFLILRTCHQIIAGLLSEHGINKANADEGLFSGNRGIFHYVLP